MLINNEIHIAQNHIDFFSEETLPTEIVIKICLKWMFFSRNTREIFIYGQLINERFKEVFRSPDMLRAVIKRVEKIPLIIVNDSQLSSAEKAAIFRNVYEKRVCSVFHENKNIYDVTNFLSELNPTERGYIRFISLNFLTDPPHFEDDELKRLFNLLPHLEKLKLPRDDSICRRVSASASEFPLTLIV